MNKCYFAAPFFSKAEQNFNLSIAEQLRKIGYDIFLPQEFLENHSKKFDSHLIFKRDIEKLNSADFLIAILEGADADSGTCFEVGYAYANNKIIYGLRTDIRKESRESINLNVMLSKSCSYLFINTEDLIAALNKALKV